MKVTTIHTGGTGGAIKRETALALNGAVRFVEFNPEDSPKRYQEPLVISLCGDEGSGKSRLLGTAQGKIGVVPTERKTRQSVLAAARECGRVVVLPDEDLIRTGNPMLTTFLRPQCVNQDDKRYAGWTLPDIQKKMQEISAGIKLDEPQPVCCLRHNYRWFADREKRVAYEFAARDDIKTIGIDSFGATVEDICYANYGQGVGTLDPKEFGFAPRQDMNQEIRAFLNAITHKNVILTHHLSAVWKDGKPTKQMKPTSNFSKIGHYASVSAKMTLNKEARVDEGEPRYVLSILDCQANASLIGLDVLFDENITFQALAALVYEDSEPEDWQ